MTASKAEVTFGAKLLEQHSVTFAVFCLLEAVARARAHSSGGNYTGACSSGGITVTIQEFQHLPLLPTILESLNFTPYLDIKPLCVGYN